MSRGSIRYIDTAYMYGQPAVTAPVSNPVIRGRFPRYIQKNSAIEKINKALSIVLFILVVFSVISYYFVSDGQRKMNNLGREIVALSNENIELQNKLDNLNSFNRVDSIIKGNTSLDIAREVIEIPAVNMGDVVKTRTLPVNYSWSIGY